MLYLIQTTLYTAAMLLVYVLFLRNKSLYGLSRAYLLCCAALPLVLPLISLPDMLQRQIQHVSPIRINLPAITISAGKTSSIQAGFLPLLWIVYGLITLFFLGRQLWSGWQLWRLVNSSPKVDLNGYTLIKESGFGPGSFGKFLFFPGSEVNETILIHEQAHGRLRHTWDILFLNLVQAAFWPNILLVAIKKEIMQVHEFQADAQTDTDKEGYTSLLLGAVFNTHSLPVMHLFIIHPIKRRIMMLQKKDTASPLKAVLQVSASLCLMLAIAGGIQSCSKKTSAPGSDAGKTVIAENSTTANDSVFKKPDQWPKLAGINDFLAKELKYPQFARDHKISGKVIVQFVVTKDGEVINPVIKKSPDTSLSTEALRVFKKMPRFEPGIVNGAKVNTEMYLPVMFKFD